MTVPQQVDVTYNHNQNSATYHAYARGSNNDNQIRNVILAQTHCNSKGLQMAGEHQRPDLLVLANDGLRQQTSYTASDMEASEVALDELS